MQQKQIIETALLSGQKTVEVNGIEIHLKKWELKRDTTRRKQIQAERNAEDILKIIYEINN